MTRARYRFIAPLLEQTAEKRNIEAIAILPVEGSILRMGDRIRISARLLEASDDRPISVALVALAHANRKLGRKEEAEKHLNNLRQLRDQARCSPTILALGYLASGIQNGHFSS